MIRMESLLIRRRGAIVTCALVASAAVLASLSPYADARADTPPDRQQVQLATQTSDLMLATLFAALLQEFAETTPANVEQGKKSDLAHFQRCE